MTIVLQRLCAPRAAFVCLVMSLNGLLLIDTSLAATTGDIALLERVLVSHRTNLERLQSWSGVAEIHLSAQRDDAPTNRKCVVRFALDQITNAWISRWEYDSGFVSGDMQRNGEWHSLPPTHLAFSDDDALAVAIRDTKLLRIGPTSDVFVPAYYFTLRNQDVSDVLSVLISNKDAEWLSLDITKDDAIVTVRFVNATLPDVLTKYQFDLSRGGNVISATVRDSLIEETWTSDWKLMSNVWTPTTWEYSSKDQQAGSWHHKTITWLEQKINTIIEPSTFSHTYFDADSKKIVTDSRSRESWVASPDGTKLNPKSPPVPANRRNLASLLILANLLALAVVLAWVKYRRRFTTTTA